jgi:hypothetical protein
VTVPYTDNSWGTGDGYALDQQYGVYDPAKAVYDPAIALYGTSQNQGGGGSGLLVDTNSLNDQTAAIGANSTNKYLNSTASGVDAKNNSWLSGSVANGAGSALDSGMGGGGGLAAGANAVGTGISIYNNSSTSTGSSVLGGVASGAQAGAAFGPWGMVIGGVIGGIVGFFGSKSKQKAEKKAFQQAEQAAVLPYQQQQANWLQQQGLKQKAIGNYASGYTPGGYQYKNALLGNPGGAPSNFKTPGNPSLPNFNVAPPNVVPGSGDKSLGIAPNSVANNGVNLNPNYNGPTNGAGLGSTQMQTPQNGFVAPPTATAPTAPTYVGKVSKDRQDISDYQKQYLAFLQAQRAAAPAQAMNSYSEFFDGGA